jgi:polyferredoxin
MKNIFTARRIIQIAVFAVLIFLSVSHMKYGVEQAASIDAYCPYGAIESFFTKVMTGDYLKRIWTSSFILMALTIVVTALFGRVFCSYFCPLGAIQEWIRGLGRKIGIKKDIELPKLIDKYARYIKYLFLLFVVYYSYKVGDLWFRNYDPYNALMHFGNEYEEKMFAYGILGAIVVGSLFSKNWWCRYFCPLGATLAIIKKISPFKIERNASTCISCGACDRVCPANLDIEVAKEIKSADCISCMNCVTDCPKGSLSAKVFDKVVTKKQLAIWAVIAFFAPLLIIMATPLWQTKAPSNILTTTGEIDVENIRGSNTLNKVLEDTRIPLSVFVEELGLPANIDTKVMLKNIATEYDIKNKAGEPLETEDFREVIKKVQTK